MTNTWWKDVEELKGDQAKLLDIDEGKSLLIEGPPGSGKTNLLLLRANQLYLGRFPNLHIIVFGSLLKQFIQMGGLQYKFPSEKIITHTRLFSDILNSEGEGFDARGMKLMDARIERVKRVSRLIQDGRIGEMFDALLLDEAQDFLEEEVRVLRRLARVIVAAADRMQAIYRVPGDPIKEILSFVDQSYPLKYHFRNGLEICKVADAIYQGKLNYTEIRPTSNYDEQKYPSRVHFKSGLSIEAQASAIAKQIVDQRFAYPDDILAVLCPRNEEVDAIAGGLASAGLEGQTTRANADHFDHGRMIWLSTIAAAKGLEFRAVHIAGLDYLSRTGQSAQKQLIYTGVTRAKTALSLYCQSSIPGYLESALQVVAPLRAPATTRQIFGKD